jgi:hypothetical protein
MLEQVWVGSGSSHQEVRRAQSGVCQLERISVSPSRYYRLAYPYENKVRIQNALKKFCRTLGGK